MGGIILWVINSSLAAVINITIILYGPHIASNTRTTFLALEARGNWRFFRIVAESTIFTGWGGIGIGARSRPEGVDIEIFLQVGGVLLKYGTNTHAFVFNGGSTDEVEELHRSFSLISSPSKKNKPIGQWHHVTALCDGFRVQIFLPIGRNLVYCISMGHLIMAISCGRLEVQIYHVEEKSS